MSDTSQPVPDPNAEEPTPKDDAPMFGDENAEANMQLYSAVLDDEPPLDEVVVRAPIWLVTFGDATALMLAFFVMLYSMSSLQSEKWEEVTSILTTRSEPVMEGEPLAVGDRTVVRFNLVEAFPIGYLERILKKKLEREPVLADIRLTGLDGQLVLSLPSDQLFQDRGVELSAQGNRILSRLSVVFRQFGNQVDIRGHTDPDPTPSTSPYKDNWERSLGQALAVAKALNASGYPGSFTVLGMADSQYQHIDPNIPEAQRYALARRVDIVIVPEARGQ